MTATTKPRKAKKCGVCKGSFEPARKNQRYCSRPCGLEAARQRQQQGALPEKPCEVCHNDFEPKRRNQRYCTDPCRRKARADQLQRRTSPEAVLSGEVSVEEAQAQRIRELEGVLRKQREADTFDKRVSDALVQATETHEPRYSPAPIRRSRKAAKHEMALLWSDLHYPEIVELEETNGINEYRPEIMWARHDRLRDRLVSHVEARRYDVDVLHVWALGDMLSGSIHEELAETNDMPLAEATIQLALDASEWLESLLELGFREIRFSGVVGNHPRFHKKPRAKHAFDNADWIAYHTMRLALRRNPAITFEIPKASMWPVMAAERWRVLLWHGDGVRSTMPGVPWGGVMRRAHALQNQYTAAGTPLDYFCVGHFHQLNDNAAGRARIYMNGSVKGVDEYSIKQFGGGAAAQQALLTFHPEHGSIGGPMYLDLEDPK